MKVYLIVWPDPDGPSCCYVYSGLVFSTRERGEAFIKSSENSYRWELEEIEVDEMVSS